MATTDRRSITLFIAMGRRMVEPSAGLTGIQRSRSRCIKSAKLKTNNRVSNETKDDRAVPGLKRRGAFLHPLAGLLSSRYGIVFLCFINNIVE